MAVSFVGSNTGETGDGSDVVIDLSGLGLQEDDVVYVAGGAAGFDASVVGRAAVNTSGYTDLENGYSGVANAAILSRKVMGATPDSSVTCAGGSGSGFNLGAAYLVMAFRGVDTTTPEDVATADDDTSYDPPSVDPVTDDCGVLAFGLVAAVATLTAPSGYSNLDQQSSSNGTADYTIGGAWKLLSGSAAEDPGSFGGDDANDVWSATIAMRPAAGGGGTPPRVYMPLLGVS